MSPRKTPTSAPKRSAASSSTAARKASASTDVPTAPAFLVGAALERWKLLIALNRFKPDQLAAYCAAYGRWVGAETWLADPNNGTTMTIRDDKGIVKSHGPAPQVGIAERSSREMARLEKGLRLR